MKFRLGKFEVNLGRSGEKRSVSITDPLGWLSYFGMGWNSTDEIVSETTAMRVATVTTCYKILGESIASLPISVMQKNGNQRTTAKHKANYLLGTRPNRYMTAYTWAFAMVSAAAGWGVAYSAITRDQYGDPISIDILPSWEVSKVTLATGEIYYRCGENIYNPDNLIILKPFTLDGINPVSIIRYNAETIGFAIKQQKYRSKIFNIKPPGYLTSDNVITKEQIPGIAENWKTQVNGGTPVLYNGLKYVPMSFSPQDLQLLEATASTKDDICGLFRIPPTMLQNYQRATFANAEQQDLVFVKYTLLPIIRNFEQELDAKLFSDENQRSETPFYTSFNVEGLLRADFKVRTEGYRTLQNIGVLSQNDIRRLEDMNPINGGDEYYVPMNMISISKSQEFYDKLIAIGGGANVKQTNGSDMTQEQRDFLQQVTNLVRMNGYNHQEHA